MPNAGTPGIFFRAHCGITHPILSLRGENLHCRLSDIMHIVNGDSVQAAAPIGRPYAEADEYNTNGGRAATSALLLVQTRMLATHRPTSRPPPLRSRRQPARRGRAPRSVGWRVHRLRSDDRSRRYRRLLPRARSQRQRGRNRSPRTQGLAMPVPTIA